MNAEIFAEWLHRQGHHVVRTASSYWYDQAPRVYQAFPYHWVIEPTKEELTGFLHRNRAIGLRYSTVLDAPSGHISYHAMYEQPYYDLASLSKWARKNVRRGLKNCTVEAISFERLAEEGWELQLDTLDRQGRDLELPHSIWQRRCLTASSLPGFEAWGALIDGRVAASVMTFRMSDCCYMLYQQAHRDYLSAHVNNALSFVVTQTMIKRDGVRSILYGLHSLDAPSSVDEFKFRMGYTARPVRQRVVFHPWIAPLFNRVTHAMIKQLMSWQPGNPTLAKAEGMIRFYLEGRLPLEQQVAPEVLRKRFHDEESG